MATDRTTATSRQGISKPSRNTTASPKSENQIDKWLAIFGEVFSKEITPALVGIWHGVFEDIPVEDLETAFEETLTGNRFFPVPADILGKLKKRIELADSSAAESDWVKAWDAAGRDAQCMLTEAGDYALRLIGGWEVLSSVGALKKENFLRKEFMEAHARYRERDKLGISDGAAKKLLGEIEKPLISEKSEG